MMHDGEPRWLSKGVTISDVVVVKEIHSLCDGRHEGNDLRFLILRYAIVTSLQYKYPSFECHWL